MRIIAMGDMITIQRHPNPRNTHRFQVIATNQASVLISVPAAAIGAVIKPRKRAQCSAAPAAAPAPASPPGIITDDGEDLPVIVES